MKRLGAFVVSIVLGAGGAEAQQRPLVTQDPESIAAESFRFETSTSYARHVRFPVSGLSGHLTTGPAVGVSVGVGGVAEFQITHISMMRLDIVDREPPLGPNPVTVLGDRTSSFDDIIVGAKMRLLSERRRRPSLGIHFSTKLPNASTESGLGLDVFDFQNSLLVGKSIGAIRLVGNLGLGILSDPTRVARQNDVIVYGVSLTSMAGAVEVVAEVNGRQNTRVQRVPLGTSSSAHVVAGLRFGRGAWRIDAAAVFGVFSDDPGVGVTGGLTWFWPGFKTT